MSGEIVKHLLNGATWTFVSRVVAALAGIGTSALLARLLSVEEFGAYFIVVSMTVTGALVGQMGTHMAVVRFIAAGIANNTSEELRPVLRGIAFLVITSSLLVALLYMSYVGNWLGGSVFHSSLITGVVGLTAIWLILRILQTLSGQTLRGFHELSIASLFDGVLSNVLLVSLLLLVWFNGSELNLEQAVKLSILAFIVTSCAGMFLVGRHWVRLPARKGVALVKVARVSMPLWVTSLAIGGMAEMHLWTLSALRPESDVALYGAASRIFVALALPLTLVNSVIQSTAADLYARSDLCRLERMLRLTATVTAVPAILAVFLLAMFAGQFLSFIFGDYYAGAASALIVLLVGQSVNLMTGSPGILMAMAGRQKPLMLLAVIAGIIGLTVTLVFSSPYGSVGAAAGMATGLVLQNVTTSYYCWRYLNIKTLPTLNVWSDLQMLVDFLKPVRNKK